jgi:hypothetical protein
VPETLNYLSTAKYPGEVLALVREPMTDGVRSASEADSASTLQFSYTNLVASPPASSQGPTLQKPVRQYRTEAEEAGD